MSAKIDWPVSEKESALVAHDKKVTKRAIAAFAWQLTGGPEGTACRMCLFSHMESAANPEESSCLLLLAGADCPIRKAAKL